MTTTNLRTNTSRLVSLLGKNDKISLIHRSKIVGIIQPVLFSAKPFDVLDLTRCLQDLKLGSTSYKQRKMAFQAHLSNKYGKNIP